MNCSVFRLPLRTRTYRLTPDGKLALNDKLLGWLPFNTAILCVMEVTL